MQPNKISDRWKINILQDEGVPKVFSKFPMEFSGGPLDFTAIGLCVVKCPLIINITLQAHAGRFGIILLYIIVTTHCPSSAYFCQFNSLNPPALASNTKHYGPSHEAQLHPPNSRNLLCYLFFIVLYCFFFTFAVAVVRSKCLYQSKGVLGMNYWPEHHFVSCVSMVLERRSKKIGPHMAGQGVK